MTWNNIYEVPGILLVSKKMVGPYSSDAIKSFYCWNNSSVFALAESRSEGNVMCLGSHF